MARNLTLNAVLTRKAWNKGLADRVRTLILGHAEDLESIFTLAYEHLPLLERIVDIDEQVDFLRIEDSGSLIALARLELTGQPGPIPYRVHWLREPTSSDVDDWRNVIQQNLEVTSGTWPHHTEAEKEAAKLNIRLIHNLMETRSLALPSGEVYPALYAVESRMGLNYARGAHVTEDIGA